MYYCLLKIYLCYLFYWNVFVWSCMFIRCSNFDIIICFCIFRGLDSICLLNLLWVIIFGCFKIKYIFLLRISIFLNFNVMYCMFVFCLFFIMFYRNWEVLMVVFFFVCCSSFFFLVSEFLKFYIMDLMELSLKKVKFLLWNCLSVIKCG